MEHQSNQEHSSPQNSPIDSRMPSSTRCWSDLLSSANTVRVFAPNASALTNQESFTTSARTSVSSLVKLCQNQPSRWPWTPSTQVVLQPEEAHCLLIDSRDFAML